MKKWSARLGLVALLTFVLAVPASASTPSVDPLGCCGNSCDCDQKN